MVKDDLSLVDQSYFRRANIVNQIKNNVLGFITTC